MYWLILVIVSMLLAPPGSHAGLLQPDRSGGLSIEQGNGTRDLSLGDILRIRATGSYARQIRQLLAAPHQAAPLRLYLDDVEMKGIPATVVGEQGAEDTLFVDFLLVRDPHDDANREAWNRLLGRKYRGYRMRLPVALAIGAAPPLVIAPPILFHIVRGKVAWTAIFVCLALFVVIYRLLVTHPNALRETPGGPYSLGKSQMAFWGLLLLLSFSAIWVLTGTMERIPDQVLVLLGISGGTGLGSIVIHQNKKSAKEAKRQARQEKLRREHERLHQGLTTMIQDESGANALLKQRLQEIETEISNLGKQEPLPESTGFWRDICDDGNGMSIHRLQVVAWTIILGAVFVRSVAQTMSIPEFSETLLILLGISNGIYLGFKFPEKI